MSNRVCSIAIVMALVCLACSSPPAGESKMKHVDIPEGSGDYREVLALATRYKARELTFAQLQDALLERKLPPHSLGDDYLMIPSPMPPPGVKFDARMMPTDWERTWGE